VSAGTKARKYFVLHLELKELMIYFKKKQLFDDGKYFDWLVASLQHNNEEGLKISKLIKFILY
jgi:hypothetical protein